MNTPRKRISSHERVELYFKLILERQRLEEQYFRTRDEALLPEIELARVQISVVQREIGI